MEISEEPRSFAPAPGRPEMKTKPIDETHPTMRALARGHNQLHECLEHARDDIDLLLRAQGLRGDRGRVSGLSSSWQAFRRTVYATTTSITAVGVLYVVGRFIAWPMLVTGWAAFDHIAMRGGL